MHMHMSMHMHMHMPHADNMYNMCKYNMYMCMCKYNMRECIHVHVL